jgi:hypothetical protein
VIEFANQRTGSGRDLADLSEELFGEFPALRVVDLECLLGGLDEGASHAAETEGGCQVAKLADLGGQGFRSHISDGT